MAQLKYYDTATSTWLPILVGAKGETGNTGATGPTGPQGLPGTSTVNVTSPILNTGTTADAIIGLNQGGLQNGVNLVLNSAFDIWQRGNSFPFGAQLYGADQWKVARTSAASGGTMSRSTTTPTDFEFATNIIRDSGNTSTNALVLTQNFEKAGLWLRGKTVTLSFYAIRGSNFSATGNLVNFGIVSSSVAPSAVAYSTNGIYLSSNANFLRTDTDVAITGSWTRYSATFTVPTTADALQIFFLYSPTGTAGANDFFRITGVQLEVGSEATAYKRNGPNVAAELASCQRYFYATTGAPAIDFNYQTDPNGFGASSFINFPVVMRVTPTVTQTFTNYDNAVNSGIISPSPLGWVSRGYRGNGSFGYFRYGTSFSASAEL